MENQWDTTTYDATTRTTIVPTKGEFHISMFTFSFVPLSHIIDKPAQYKQKNTPMLQYAFV